MNKKLIAVIVAVAFIASAFTLPNVIFAQSGTFEEAVNSFNAAKQSLQAETNNFKEKVKTIKSLSEEVNKLLKEKKESGQELSEEEKADLKKLYKARTEIRKGMLIRNARGEYAKKLFSKIKALKEEIKQKKENGATKEELKPLIEKSKRLFSDLRLVAPLTPERMLKSADKVMQKAESLNKNGKEKEAIKLLDKTAKGFEAATKALKNRESKADELINLLNKIKGELSQ